MSGFLFTLKKRFVRLMLNIILFPAPRLRRHWTDFLIKVPFCTLCRESFRVTFRRPRNQKYDFSILACCKDEEAYLEEWIEFYRLQGAEHFWLYNNNGTDRSKERIQRYIDQGIVSWIDWPGVKQQLNMYADGIRRAREETRWLAIVDLDEFLFPTASHCSLIENQRGGVAKLLANYENSAQILVPWYLYGSSGHLKKEPGLVIERFTQRDRNISNFTKAIVRPWCVVVPHVHSNLVFGRTVDEHNHPLYYGEHPQSADILRLNHYVVKSKEEFIDKKKRGDALYGGTFIDQFFTEHDRNDVFDNSASVYARSILTALD